MGWAGQKNLPKRGIEIIGGKAGTDDTLNADDIEVLETLIGIVKKAGIKNFNISLNIGQRHWSAGRAAAIAKENEMPPDSNSMIAGRSMVSINRRMENRGQSNACVPNRPPKMPKPKCKNG